MMLNRLLKDWTLPAAMVVGTLGYLFFANTPAFDSFGAWAGPVCDKILPLFMFGILFVTFCKVDFHRMRPVKWHFWAGATQIAFVIVTGTTVRNICHADTIGRRIGRRFGRINEAGQALGQKNTTFAIWIAYTYLTPLSSVGPGCYILWQNTVNSIEIYQYKKAGKLQKS